MNDLSRQIASPPEALFRPQVRLEGEVGDDMLRTFRQAFDEAQQGEDPIVVELTTPGGDADVGRRIAGDIRLFRERTGRAPLLFGKAVVYSAGVTILSGFRPGDRWLAKGTVLLVHGRSLGRTMELNGPLLQEKKRIEALLAEIETGLKLERDGFRELIDGSRVTLEEVLDRAQTNWYLDADEALARGLVGGVV